MKLIVQVLLLTLLMIMYTVVQTQVHVTTMQMRQQMMVVVTMVQYAGMVQQSVMQMTVQISQVVQLI